MIHHEEVFEMLGAYALEALDEADIALVQAHLSECEDCQRELAGFMEVTARLARLGPVQPPELRDRILTAVRQESNAQKTYAQRPPRRISPQWLGATVLVALLIAQVWLLREVFSLRTTIEQQRQIQTVLLSAEEAPIEMESPDPDSTAHGYYRAEPELHMGLLNYYHLPHLTPEKSYQCWFESSDRPAINCGILPVDDDGHGVLLIAIPQPLPDRIRVTVEEDDLSTPSDSTILEGHLYWN
jgi:hypothetical protein